MGRNDRDAVTSESIAVGIKGDRHSLCGAIKRFELNGQQWNSLLSLKEQCARRIALIKNEQLKCFILAYLSSNLFQYVTKDIFNLQRDEFVLNYAKPLYMCQECTMDSYEDPSNDCQCPQMYDAIDALNKYFYKRMNDENEEVITDESKEFRLIYKIPNDGQDHTYELKRPTSFFLYFSPVHYSHGSDMDYGTFAKYYLINSQISIEDKLLFVDAMRFFGGFRSEYEEPQIIFYRRREYYL
jgi:hypothetical protein